MLNGVMWLCGYSQSELMGQRIALLFPADHLAEEKSLEFLTIIKPDANWRTISVVILTTSSEFEDKSASYDLGVADYLMKPLEYPAFVEKRWVIFHYWDINETDCVSVE